MQIKTVNLLTYIFEIHPHFEESALTFAKAAFNHDGKLLVLFEGEEPVGLLILEVPDRFDYGVSYLYIRPEWRGKGKAKALLKAAIDLAAEAKRMLQLRIIEENPEAPVFTKWAKDFEFTKVMASKIFVCIPQNKETLKNWEDFMASRGIRLSRYLQRNGYTVSSLRAADPQVMASMNEKFESGVFPSYLGGQADGVEKDPDYSFIASKNGEAIAYCMAEAYGEKVVLRALMVDKRYQKKGIFMMPLMAFINRTFEQKRALVTYTVYDNNQAMLPLAEGFLQMLTSRVKHQSFYKK